ncbi:MAG: hypothetical protein R3F20_08680 [Planctomycetota bacterium]
MATRAERADEAIAFAENWPGILWALAVNTTPVRKGYLEAVSGAVGRPLIRALAKMANQGFLAETEGIEFQLDRKVFGGELRERVPAEIAAELHEKSLAWGERHAPDDLVFRLGHLVGAGRWPEACDDVLEVFGRRLSSGVTPGPGEVARAKAVLIGLLDDPRAHRGRILELGMLLLGSCRAFLKPGEIKNMIASLRELAPGEEIEGRLAAVEEAARQDSKERRRKKKAAAEGEEAAVAVAETPPAEAPSEALPEPAPDAVAS